MRMIETRDMRERAEKNKSKDKLRRVRTKATDKCGLKEYTNISEFMSVSSSKRV